LATDDPLYNITKKGIPGLLKNEVAPRKINAFVGLKRKMYAFKFFDSKFSKLRAKGVPRQALKQFSFLTYCSTLKRKKNFTLLFVLFVQLNANFTLFCKAKLLLQHYGLIGTY